MKYKVGDKVRIKSLEWYKANRGTSGDIAIGGTFFRDFMSQFCGSVVTIESITLIDNLICYRIKEDGKHYCWTDEMIEGLVEEETKSTLSKNAKLVSERFAEDVNVSEFKPHQDEIMKLLLQGALNIPEGYIFKDENGNVINATKIFLEKKKKEYPKTYEECAGRIMRVELWNCLWGEDATEYEEQMEDLMDAFIKLKICRDAYWKIAGEEMGLGKPWKPTHKDSVFSISRMHGKILTECHLGGCCIFEFPTKEMRDAFYENFKKEIEFVKELL